MLDKGIAPIPDSLHRLLHIVKHCGIGNVKCVWGPLKAVLSGGEVGIVKKRAYPDAGADADVLHLTGKAAHIGKTPVSSVPGAAYRMRLPSVINDHMRAVFVSGAKR